jgi:three-Cys-motif partner protein
MAGSARRALAIEPPFDHFHFNEQNSDRNKVLTELKNEFPNRHIVVTAEDANQLLISAFSRRPWTLGASSKTRGVVFLDPYALQVEWKTLELLARTRAVDVWYLFPLRDVTRQLARQRSGIGPKEDRLDRVLSERWRDLYSLPPPEKVLRQADMFGNPNDQEEERSASQKQIEQWFRELLGTQFPYASDPLPLLTGGSRQAFSLFLCVANPSSKAVELAKHFHGYVMKNFASGASRRKSAP